MAPIRRKTFVAAGACIACLALVLAVSRCSPVAPSIAKHKVLSDTNEAIPVQVFRYQTVLVHSDAQDSPSDPRTDKDTVLRLTRTQFAELKATGRAELKLSLDRTPDQGKGVFKVDLRREQLEDRGLSTFETDLRPAADGTWVLSVSDSVTADVSKQIRDHLIDVTVTLSAEPATEL